MIAKLQGSVGENVTVFIKVGHNSICCYVSVILIVFFCE